MPLIILFLCSLFVDSVLAAELTGRVTNVTGPLEVELITEAGVRQPIVLQGIQMDLKRPDVSAALRTRLQGLIAGRFVRVTIQGERSQGKLLGFVDWGGKEINLTLVEDGLVIPLAGQLDIDRLSRYEAAAARAGEVSRPGFERREYRPAPAVVPQSPGSSRH